MSDKEHPIADRWKLNRRRRPANGGRTVIKFSEYQALAARTRNKRLEPRDNLANGALGLTGEAGEVADLLKKHLYQGHLVDRDQLKDELGDVLWYISDMATTLGLNLGEVAEHNIKKLQARYPEGFSADKSQNRGE